MTAYKCDVCGALFEVSPDEEPELELSKVERKDGTTIYRTMDLCPRCYRKIYNILHRSKKQHAKVVEYETPELNGGFEFK